MSTLGSSQNQDSVLSMMSLYEQILQIPNETLKNIDSFRNKYLGNILKTIYATYPETRDMILSELNKAIANKSHDKAQQLIDEASFPLYPNQPKLDDFDPSCLNEIDRTLFQDLKTFNFFTSDKPNLTLFGPQHFGCEKLASGFGDALCRRLHRVFYITFHHLISLLQTHGIKTDKNNEYEELQKKECLIIEDFAGESIHDKDLLSELYIFLDGRISAHRKSFSETYGKNQKMKPRVTIITTCRAYEEWYNFFDCDQGKASSLIALFHGYGDILYVDETNKPENAT